MGNCEKFKHFYCQVVEELRPKKKKMDGNRKIIAGQTGVKLSWKLCRV